MEEVSFSMFSSNLNSVRIVRDTSKGTIKGLCNQQSLWVTCRLSTVEEEHAIQTDKFVYTRFHARYIPSDSQETSLQVYAHVLVQR